MRPAGTGGTGQSTYVTGDILYASAANTLSRLAAGSTNQVLTMVAGVPIWSGGQGGTPAVRGLVGLNNAGTPTSKYDMSATLVTLRNPTTGVTRTVAAATTVTNDIAAATTTNGRDQAAAFTASSWVYFYFTGTGTGSPTTLSSASATGPTLLAGQTEWALAAAVYNNATPRLVATRFAGSHGFYEARQNALNASVSTTEAAVSMTTVIPPNALTAVLSATGVSADANGGFQIRLLTGIIFYDTDSGLNGSTRAPFFYGEVPNLSQQLFVTRLSLLNTIIDCHGYTLPNGDS